jgi:hypothetical protein
MRKGKLILASKIYLVLAVLAVFFTAVLTLFITEKNPVIYTNFTIFQ